MSKLVALSLDLVVAMTGVDFTDAQIFSTLSTSQVIVSLYQHSQSSGFVNRFPHLEIWSNQGALFRLQVR